jgi:aminopeptidase N
MMLVIGVSATGLAAGGPHAYSPREIHQAEAESKARALQRRIAAIRPATVVDQGGFDAVYYHLDLGLCEVEQVIYSGSVQMRARAQVTAFDSPTLNFLEAMTVDSVHSYGNPIPWSHVGDFLYATLDASYDIGEEFDLTVFYHGAPPTGGLMAFSFGSHAGTPIMSTLSEPYSAQSWWPCKDTPSDKADSADIRVTVNSAFYAVSNGTLRDSTDNGDGTTTYWWHEEYPITTYLISLAITNYARFDRWYHYGPGDADSMPVRFYTYPELLETAEASWPIAVAQIDFFSDIWGEYPFVNEKYGIAHFTWGGAMEHQTVSSHTASGFGFNTYLIGHELSHQWWGDMITCRDWHNIWLNEGFASYAEALWAEHAEGREAYHDYMAGMSYYSGGRIYIDDTTNVWNIFSSRVYDKGAWVLHMLRGFLGDAVFFDVLRTYYAHPDHQYKDAVTEDFQAIAESVSGQDLEWFFDEWIYGYYFPRYNYSWFAEPNWGGGWTTYVHIRQSQTTDPQVFAMPIPIAMEGFGNADTVTIWNAEREDDYAIVVPFEPESVILDAGNWVLDIANEESYGVRIVSESLVGGDQYLPYRDSIVAKGADPGTDYEYVDWSGTLPAGLVIDSTSGVVSGTPVDSGTAAVTFRAGGLIGDVMVFDHKTISIHVAGATYRPGDQNGDRVLDVIDVVDLIGFVFRAEDPPVPIDAADTNGDCGVDVLDVVTLIDHVFRDKQLPAFGCIQ